MPRLLTGTDIKNFYNSGAKYLVLADGQFLHVTPGPTEVDSHDLPDVLFPRDKPLGYVRLTDADRETILMRRDSFNASPDANWRFYVWDDAGNFRDSELDLIAERINRESGPELLAEWEAYVESVAQEARDLAAKAQQDAADAQESAMERARAVARFAKLCNSGQVEAARRLGLDASTVNKLVRKVADEERQQRDAGLVG